MNNFPDPLAVRFPLRAKVDVFVGMLTLHRQINEKTYGDHVRKVIVRKEIVEEDIVINQDH